MSKRRRESAAGSAAENALVERLKRLEWPKPTEEVRRRCFEEILARVDEAKREDRHDVSRLWAERPARGFGERHPLTRRGGALSHRQPLALPRRPLAPTRVATVLW